jgi:hypothetical protein
MTSCRALAKRSIIQTVSFSSTPLDLGNVCFWQIVLKKSGRKAQAEA